MTRKLRLALGIDDYSWRQFQDLDDADRTRVLLELEKLAPEFEKRPDRWGPCFCGLSRGFRQAERYQEASR